jgi:ribosomal protein S18 acetylase RimI-like enzyme
VHRPTLRAADPADGATIARIQLAAWRATYGHLNPEMVDRLDLTRTADNWTAATTDPVHRLRLAEYAGAVVGYAHSGPADGESDDVGELHAVYLLSSAQGIGAGRLLAEDALRGLAEAGCTECILWVAEENSHARGFYEHLGFRTDDGRDTWRGLTVVRYRRATHPVPRSQGDQR